jgi:transcriptional regulator with XRE-family HTH domain
MGDVIHLSLVVKSLHNPPNRIRELRKARGMTQRDVADAVGSKENTIGRFETGERPIDMPWMQKIARALGVAVGDLLNADDNPNAARNEAERLAIQAARVDERAADTIQRVAEAQLGIVVDLAQRRRESF